MQLEKIQNLLKSKLKQTQKEIIQNSEQKESIKSKEELEHYKNYKLLKKLIINETIIIN